MQHPKISAIVPNYNHARFLGERIDSILSQTFGDLELIILDDASTDGSHHVLAQYYARPRIRIVVNTKNTGAAFPQWNRGIALARGEYVWIAESDDSADPHFLERLLPLLDENPGAGLAYCQSRLINPEGVEIGNSLEWSSDLDPVRWQTDFLNSGADEIRKYLIVKNTIPNASAVLLRRSVLLQTMPVDTSYKLCGDWLHWGKILLRSDVAYTAMPLNHWRLDSSNSRSQVPGVLEWKEGQRIIRHLGEGVGFTEREITDAILRFADRCLAWAASSVNHNAPARVAAT